MALLTLKYNSPALGKQVTANILLPQDARGPFAVLYLFHGLTGDYTIWQRLTRLESHLEALGAPLMVVMPDLGRSFCTDAEHGPAYESAIIRDLIPFIDSSFNTRAHREGRAVGGMSMGGCAALKLALRNPELFVSANSHAGGVMWARKHDVSPYAEREKQAGEWLRILGGNTADSENDLWWLARQTVGLPRHPALYIDCGTEDFLLEENRELHRHLERIGYAHEYVETPGRHDGAFMDASVPGALRFHARHLFS